MPLLKRSCEACARAKQTAVYHPYQQLTCVDKEDRSLGFELGLATTITVQYLDRCSSHFDNLPIPEIVRSFDANTTQRLVRILQSFPGDFAKSGATSFVHPALYDMQLPPPLKKVRDICGYYLSQKGQLTGTLHRILQLEIKLLLRQAKRAKSFIELLACSQALVLAQLLRLLEGQGEANLHGAERDNKLMQTLSYQLWEDAPSHLPAEMSAWRAWVFAESVRRTIMVCSIFLITYDVLRRGHALQALCVEALPFDVRTQLWDAGTADDWLAASSICQGPSLVTIHEFTSLRQQSANVSAFESLLLLSFDRGQRGTA
ncbi:unnamed protein product [Clonostachys rhizophaga]|uniref:Uncharacterized protein n=1 Tax=Clonostachys rhizophaga TaxID=160324 RepID=A0A9N9YSJ5_9HYPO|nr:unnamed protein product [Clonostachys rhizophaga]